MKFDFEGGLVGRLGLLETRNAVPVFPFAALAEKFNALETLEDVALYGAAAGRFVAWML